MSAPKQRTLQSEVSLDGVGVHTGRPVRVWIRPAPESHGIKFRRVDLDGSPTIPADLDHVAGTELSTTLQCGDARVQTVEHLMAASAALGLDNLLVDVDGPEIPILDGSFWPIVDALESAGVAEQDAPARVLTWRDPVRVTAGSATYVAVPEDTYRISAGIQFDHALIGRQFASFEVSAAEFRNEVAPARTFGFLKDAEALRARNMALGASTENAVVLDDTGVVTGELRFSDEFVRHKIGDMIGDLALLGGRIRGHIVADRPSHGGNVALAREIRKAVEKSAPKPVVDIQKIMQYLPHRYPMLLVDRIIEFESGKRIVGIKNVTINEPFFQGHYPGHPIMPGVLIIEAMAQVGGLLLMDAIERPEDQVVYFMSLDNVKWRRPVTPGDQIRFELEVLNLRRHVCRMRGVGTVDGHLVAEAEMMARIMDR